MFKYVEPRWGGARPDAETIPAGTVKSRLYHTRQELKKLLERSES